MVMKAQPSDKERKTREELPEKALREQTAFALEKTAALREQSENLRRMIDGVPSGLGALHIRQGIPDKTMQINRYFIERIDIAVGEDSCVDLRSFLDCLHPEDRTSFREDFFTFLKEKALSTRQYRFRTRGGEYVWGSIRGTFVKLSDSEEIAYFNYANIDDIKLVEAQLRESRRFYREVVKAAKLSTWDYDIRTHTIVLSDDEHTDEARKILDLTNIITNVPDSLVGSISREDQPAFLKMYSEVDAGRNASCEVWYKPVNGREPRCERIVYIAVDAPDGIPAHAIGFTQNITAEKKVEERYQRELGYLRRTDENDLVAKGHYNLTRNEVLAYCTKNDCFLGIEPGTSYDDALGMLVGLAYDENERRQTADRLDRGRLIESYQHGQLQHNLVYRRARRGDLPIWISMNIHTYMSPETGDLECFTYAYDITEKIQSDEIMGRIADEEFDYIGLIFAEADQFEFIKKSPEILFPDVRQRTAYSKCCAYVRKNFVNEDECGPFDAAVDLKNILAGLETANKYVSTYRRTENSELYCKQLDYIWLDKTEKIILVVRTDVTTAFRRDRLQLAHIEAARLEAERANEAKSTFLASMSHDLRTPLNGVIGFTGLALREEDPAKKQEYLKKIDSSGKLLLDLVNDTLELSCVESGKAVLEPETVMPGKLIPAVVTALRPSAELKGVKLVESYRDPQDVPLWCDKLKVQKIALNLISNAIKYTPAGGSVSVSVSRGVGQTQDCGWTLRVEDNGIGISEAFMERMFEPFTQEKRSESVKTPGTGLGLAIVKRYVDLMGGKIDVTSRLHEGTRWAVSLPICEAVDGEIKKQETEVVLRSLAGKRVLLCEDNEMNTEIASMLLKEKGMLVDSAENGREGLERFSASPEGYYDAVLMDLRMPVMDGQSATRAIRALERRDAPRVPIIAMTADAFEESIREAKQAGMTGYVTKPVESAKLYRTLAQLIYGV